VKHQRKKRPGEQPGLEREEVLHYSGWEIGPNAALQPLKAGKYRVKNVSIMGDAPKAFLHVYRYGEGRRSRPQQWPGYIAKVGHKWYPNEAITEQFITRLGQGIGLEMADSDLFLARGQLRFGSRYFLKSQESLVHGAELFWGYLDDRDLVERIEAANEAREFFTFQFVQDALLNRFPEQAYPILKQFVSMLAFDAIIGNNDRHFYNWGVIVHPEGKSNPRFAPIYDTARAFFWNFPERRVVALSQDEQQYAAKLKKYAVECRPKIGWDNLPDPNHFQLMEEISKSAVEWRESIASLISQPVVETAEELLSGREFSDLMSEPRKSLILDCLRERLQILRSIIVY
jgi:hypothetical protein